MPFNELILPKFCFVSSHSVELVGFPGKYPSEKRTLLVRCRVWFEASALFGSKISNWFSLIF